MSVHSANNEFAVIEDVDGNDEWNSSVDKIIRSDWDGNNVNWSAPVMVH